MNIYVIRTLSLLKRELLGQFKGIKTFT